LLSAGFGEQEQRKRVMRRRGIIVRPEAKMCFERLQMEMMWEAMKNLNNEPLDRFDWNLWN
jgi:DNA-binding Lrp family transcriptional regulator